MNMTVAKARENFADTINRVQYSAQRIMLKRHGKGVAAIVPIEDLELLERIHDEKDAKALSRDIRLYKEGQLKTISLDELSAKLDRKWGRK